MYTASDDIVWKKKKDVIVLLNTKLGYYYTLNETAGALWQEMLVDNKSFEDAVKTIKESFDVSPSEEQIISDCDEIIKNWLSEGLIGEKEAD
ncbi:MAG: PqqD family protein [Spirochaetes bacterium]|nr:PqqD family protein [Spirochaetota bacterium]MBN2770145.1 PqqD family protein [Spirochaetota bacterium]